MVKVHAAPAPGGGWVCDVEVDAGGEHTRHTVTVRRRELERWGRGDVVDLVTRSFGFLLEREPAGAILRRFDLSVIERYFPQFGSEITR